MIIDERLSTYIDSISWDIPKYLKEVEKAALADEVPIIRRSMQSLISFLLEMKKPNAVLEIGTAVGFSSMFMSEYVPEDTIIDTIEKVPIRIKCAKENFERYGKNDRITLYEGDAVDVLKKLAAEGRKYVSEIYPVYPLHLYVKYGYVYFIFFNILYCLLCIFKQSLDFKFRYVLCLLHKGH